MDEAATEAHAFHNMPLYHSVRVERSTDKHAREGMELHEKYMVREMVC